MNNKRIEDDEEGASFSVVKNVSIDPVNSTRGNVTKNDTGQFLVKEVYP